MQTKDDEVQAVHLRRPISRRRALNADIMAKYRPLMRKYYYDPTKYKTYLEQLGIKYPTIKPKAATN